jgi:hypothetical protein
MDGGAELPPLSLAAKLQAARAAAAKWSAIAADPDLSPAAALFARNMARSSQVAATLGAKALAYQDRKALRAKR